MSWVLVLACVVGAVGVTLGVVIWLAREALKLLASWFLGWDKDA